MLHNPNVPEENYPFATKDGKTIPLDIIKPNSLIYQPVSTTPVSFNLPKSTGVCYVYSTVDCFLKMPGEEETTPAFTAIPADGVPEENCLFVPKNNAIIVAVNYGFVRAIALSESGFVVIQEATRWASADLDTNFTNR